MKKFYEFTNVTDNSAELLVYGDIVTEKPWWADNDDGFVAQNQFIKDLQALGPKDQITVRINSFGGEVFAATAMATHLRDNQAEIIARIDGVSASAATIISSAADRTQMVNTGIFMVHDPMLFLFGSYNDQELQGVQNALGAVKKAIVNGYIAKTGLNETELSDIMSNETWMTAQEAKDLGFVDEILYDTGIEGEVSNDAKHIFYNSVEHDVSKFKFKNLQLEKFKNLAPKPVKVNNKPTQVENRSTSQEGGNVPMNLEQLKKDHPDVYNQVVNETLNAERTRMQEIDKIANTMSPQMVEDAKYKNFSSAKDLAYEALTAQSQSGQNYLNQVEKDLTPGTAEPVTNQVKEGKTEATVVPVAEAKPAVEPKNVTPKEKVTNSVKAAANNLDRKRRGVENGQQ